MGYLDKLYAEQRRMAAGEAPEDERRHVQHDLLERIVAGLSRQDMAEAHEIRQRVRALPRFAKARVLEPTLYQATYPAAYKANRPKHQAILYCSDLAFGNLVPGERWAEKPAGYGAFAFLKVMARQVDIVQAIIASLVRGASKYFKRYRPDDANPYGYSWVREDGERVSKDDQKEIDRLDLILQNCGVETDTATRRWHERRRTLRGFMHAALVDSLTADWCPTETVRARNGSLLGWHNIPFETIRIAHEDGYEGDDSIVAVQIDPSSRQPVVAFEADEIVCETRNPRSDIALGDYGYAELESLVRTLTIYLDVVAATAASLSRNTLPRGAMVVHGEYDKAALLDLQDNWNALMTGAANQFKFPILTSKSKSEGGLTWVPFDQGRSDVLATKTLTLVASVACAEFGVAPESVHLESFSSDKSSLSGSDTAQKLDSSHDSGHVPLVTWAFDSFLNPNFVKQLTPKYRLVPVGLFPADEARKHERQKLTLTENEMRAIDGVDPHPSEIIGDAPLNPSLLSLYIQEQQQLGNLQPPQQPGGEDGDQGDQPPGRPSGMGPADIGLTGSEAPLPREDDGGAPGGRSRMVKAKTARGGMRVTIRHVAADEVWP